MKRLINQSLEAVRELFFPKTCVICDDLLIYGELGICEFCKFHLPYSSFEFDSENPIVKALWGRCSLSHGYHLLNYRRGSMASKLLHAIKYQNQKDLAILMGNEVGKSLIRSTAISTIDAIVPVPMHEKKVRKRGYNQAELLANGISSITGVPVWSDFLRQMRLTESQTVRGRSDRVSNSGNKYQLNVNLNNLQFKHILLVDDVMTTGSTIMAAEHAIRTSLNREKLEVSVATLSYVF